MLLIAMVLILWGNFCYYRAIVHLREQLDLASRGRKTSSKFLALEELSLISNPVRMYRLIFNGKDGIAVEQGALLSIRKKFIASLIMGVSGTALIGIYALLR